MTGWIIVVDHRRPDNWEIAKEQDLWATHVQKDVNSGDDVFFWMSGGGGLFAHARATTSSARVTSEVALPWPDRAEKPYTRYWSMDVLAESPTPVITSWSEVQHEMSTASEN